MQCSIIIDITRQGQNGNTMAKAVYKLVCCVVAPDLQTINWLFVAAQGGHIGKCYTVTASKTLLPPFSIFCNNTEFFVKAFVIRELTNFFL